MAGQGRPKTVAAAVVNRAEQADVSSINCRLSRFLLCAVLILGGVCSMAARPVSVAAQPVSSTPSLSTDATDNRIDLRLRISLGGGQARRWLGSISLDGNFVKFSGLTPRGLNVDANAAIRLERGTIEIFHANETNYNGIDVSVQGSPSSTLNVRLATVDQPDQHVEYSVKLSDIVTESDHRDLDQTGNRCSIERVPGDQLVFETKRPHLIFRPGEQLEFSVAANRTSFLSTACLCRLVVTEARRAKSAITPWDKSTSLTCDETGSAAAVPMSLQVPSHEGVYDITFELQPGGFQTSFSRQQKLIRKVQIVVLEDSVPPTRKRTLKNSGWKQHTRFSPAELMDASKDAHSNPFSNSIAQFKTETLGLQETRRCYGNARRQLVETIDGPAVQFEAGGWQAIPILAPAEKGPCLIEVDCMVGGEAALGVSLLQFDATGQVSALRQDAGLVAQRSVIGNDAPAKQTYRLYHWPNESVAWLVLANRHASRELQILDVRVLTGPTRIPVLEQIQPDHVADSNQPSRSMMTFLETPTFPENFGASDYLDESAGQLLDDWVTFYEGVDRLIQHLKARNLAGAFVTVAADGSGLYPSQTLQPGPVYDSGCFLSNGNDPMRKDVVELMFRMFEREQLKLVPVVSLNGPLPAVDSAAEAKLVDYNGEALPAAGVKNLPRYNPLAPAVQDAVATIIEELVDRYRHHETFRGVAVTCRPDTVTLLPGQQWACDRLTLERFLNSTSVDDANLAGLHDQAQLMELVLGSYREDWLAWRANQMAAFYRQLGSIVKGALPEGTLYLAPIDLYRNVEIAAALNPGLHASCDYRNAMLRLGFDSSWSTENADTSSVVLLNPHRVSSSQSLASERVDAHVAALDQMNELFIGRENRGDLFVHRDSWVHFAQLEQEPPFKNQQGPLMRRQQLMPVGNLNRRRFVERLFATDSRMLVDSSWSLPVVQGDSLTELGHVYSQLPSINFDDVTAVDSDWVSEVPGRSLPVVVRQVSTATDAWFYAVNSSPWPINVRVQLADSDAADVERGQGLAADKWFKSLSEKLLESALLQPLQENGARVLPVYHSCLEPCGRALFGSADSIEGVLD